MSHVPSGVGYPGYGICRVIYLGVGYLGGDRICMGRYPEGKVSGGRISTGRISNRVGSSCQGYIIQCGKSMCLSVSFGAI